VRGSFSTPSNECKRVHATTDRPTDAGKRRERCSLRATRENDAKNLLRKITTRENLPPLWEREKIETKTRKQTKARVSYLDDGAQTSRGWCNPPGASPDTINRSSRPRLSRANRRCPELRSVTRTPFTANLFGYVSVFELFLSRTNFLSQRKRGTFSLCVCSLLPLTLRRARFLSARYGRPSRLSLFTNNNALFSFLRYVRFVLWGEKELTIHPKTEAAFRSVKCWCWFRLG
jgi:hypothetical protein